MKPTADDWRSLDAGLEGDVARPDDDAYELWRKPAIARFHDVRPQAVVRCRNSADVVEAVSFARRHSLATATRAGGHDFAGRSSTTGMVLDLSLMNDVSLAGGVLTTGAGTTLGDLYRSLVASGRAIPGGSCPTVGIGGLTLGGGLGWLGRTYGLTCDRLVQAQVALPDGRIVECDADREPELFWALQGAGSGHLGVVTSMRFETVPLPSWTVFEGVFDYRHAARVVDAWQSWSPDAPDAVAASLILTVPADLQQPPHVRVWGAAAEHSAEETDEFFDALARLVGVQPRTWWRHTQSWPDNDRPLSDDAPSDDTGHLFVKSEFFRRPLPKSAVDELVGLLVSDRCDGEERELDLSPWGGAYNRRAFDATAFPHRDARFLVKHAALVRSPPPGSATSVPSDWLRHSWDLVHPWGTGGVFPNFPDADLAYPQRAYFGPNFERVMRARAAYDPDGFLSR